MKDASIRQARWRERQKQGLRVDAIEVPVDSVDVPVDTIVPITTPVTDEIMDKCGLNSPETAFLANISRQLERIAALLERELG